jgi:heptosyltransferase-1
MRPGQACFAGVAIEEEQSSFAAKFVERPVVKILLVKLSSLGDVVHTLPVVQDILGTMPDAHIDWVVEKSFAPLLTQVKGVARIIPCELRRWRKSFWTAPTRREWRAFKADLQQERYDAVIDLQGLSKSALVARLARLSPQGKRYAMANQTEGSGYEAPTRWAADVAIAIEPHIHAVARGRWLAAQALGYSADLSKMALNYGLKVPAAQSKCAQAAPENIAKKILFIHGTSRQDKTWPLPNWVELGRRLAATGQHITLVHGSAAELAVSQDIAVQLGNKSTVLPLMTLDALMQELASCQGAIGVDSGVSHIAVALGLPHVQIYNFATAWRTGPSEPHQVSVFAQPFPPVDAVWQAWQSCSHTAESTAQRTAERTVESAA